MIVTIPFQYNIVVRMPRKRLDDTFTVRDSVDVMINETTMADVDPVMTYLHAQRRFHPGSNVEHTTVTRIAHEGRFLRNAVLGYDGDKGTATRTDLARSIEPGNINEREIEHLIDLQLVPHAYSRSGHNRYKVVNDIAEIGCKYVVSSAYEEAVAAIRAKAETILIVNDHVFREAPEPILQIESYGERYRYQALVPIVPEKITPLKSYRADRAEELAERYYEALHGAGRDVEGFKERFLQYAPTVHRPDLITYDQDAIDFRQMAALILSRLQDMAKDGNPAVLTALAAFTPEVDAMNADLAQTLPKAGLLRDTYNRFYATLDESDRNRFLVKPKHFAKTAGLLVEREREDLAIVGRMPAVAASDVVGYAIRVTLDAGLASEMIVAALRETKPDGLVSVSNDDETLMMVIMAPDVVTAQAAAISLVETAAAPDDGFNMTP